jgi:hypothetical protein
VGFNTAAFPLVFLFGTFSMHLSPAVCPSAGVTVISLVCLVSPFFPVFISYKKEWVALFPGTGLKLAGIVTSTVCVSFVVVPSLEDEDEDEDLVVFFSTGPLLVKYLSKPAISHLWLVKCVIKVDVVVCFLDNALAFAFVTALANHRCSLTPSKNFPIFR